MACLVELRKDTRWPTSPGFPVEENQNKETEQILNTVFQENFLEIKNFFWTSTKIKTIEKNIVKNLPPTHLIPILVLSTANKYYY